MRYFAIHIKELTRYFFFFFICFWVLNSSMAQTPYRPKLAEFSVSTWRDYGVRTHSENFTNASNEIEVERLVNARLGIPLFLKENKIFGLQLKYNQHRFEFDLDDQPTDDEFFQHLDSRVFTSAGVRFFYQEDLPNERQLRIVGGSELKSDVFQLNRNTMKHFVSGTYTWRTTKSTEMGTGLFLNHTMGLTSIYPLFIFNKDLSRKWTVNLTLPKSASMRYNWNDRNFLIATTELAGWRYNLTDLGSEEMLVDDERHFTLRRIDLRLSLSWEHEIHDWLWFGVDVGYNKNLQYFVVNSGDRGRDALINLRTQDAVYSKVSLFIVPPRKFFR